MPFIWHTIIPVQIGISPLPRISYLLKISISFLFSQAFTCRRCRRKTRASIIFNCFHKINKQIWIEIQRWLGQKTERLPRKCFNFLSFHVLHKIQEHLFTGILQNSCPENLDKFPETQHGGVLS